MWAALGHNPLRRTVMVHTNIAKREDPIERELGKLRDFAAQSDQATRSIIEGLEQTSSPIKNQAITVCNDLKKIQNVEYQDLVAVLNLARSNNLPLLPALNQILEAGYSSLAFQRVAQGIGDIFKFLKTPRLELVKAYFFNSSPFSEENFIDQTLRLVRVAYPFGVNLVNPRWNDDMPVALDSSKKITLANAGAHRGASAERVEIIPEGSRLSLTFYDEKNVLQANYILLENKMATIGRSLQLGPLFDENLKFSLKVDLKIPSEITTWSRGGVLMVWLGKDMYLFDRGCRNELVVAVSGKNFLTYNPTVTGQEGSRHTLGHTIISKAD